MALQCTCLAHVSLCTGVAESHNFAIRFHCVNLHVKLQRERAPAMQVRLQKVSLHLTWGSMKFVQQAQCSVSILDNFMGEKKKRRNRFSQALNV